MARSGRNKSDNECLNDIAYNGVTATIGAGDIEIGAVEFKNAATDDRALVAAQGGTPTFALAVLPVVANAAAPTLTEAKAAYISTDLAGNQRVILLGASRTPAIASVSSSGSVAAGKKVVDFIFSSDFTGTVLTVAFAGANDSVISFEAPPGDTLAAIAYTVTAGSIRISTIT